MKPSRRRFLQWAAGVGILGTAGCSSGEPTDTPAAESTPTVTQSPIQSPSAKPTPTEQPAEESCSATDPEPPSSEDEWWSMYLYDRYNRQYNETTTGPSPPVGYGWRFETGGKVFSSPAVVNDSVYIGSTDGKVYSLDMVNGQERWAFETEGPVTSSPAVLNGVVYVGSNDHHVYALDANSGEKRWQFETQGKVRSSPTVVDPEYREGAVMVIGSDDGRVYVIDTATASLIHDIETDGPVLSTAFIAEWGYQSRDPSDPLPKIFEVVSTGGDKYYSWLTGYGGRAGDEIIEKPTEWSAGAPSYSSITTRRDYGTRGATAYWGNDDGQLNQFTEVDDERPAWVFETDGKIRSSPALADSPWRLYVGSWDQNVYAVDYDTGEEFWKFSTNGKVESSPAVADGVVYVGSGDNHVYAIDTESGEELWEFRTGGAVQSSPAVVNGTVFVGSSDGHVYALTSCQ